MPGDIERKEWVREQIRKSFDVYNRDLLLKYEIAYFFNQMEFR